MAHFNKGDKVQVARINQGIVHFAQLGAGFETCWVNGHTLLLMKKLGKFGVVVETYADDLGIKVQFDNNPADFFNFYENELRLIEFVVPGTGKENH